jgi:hypothetical protein
LQYGLWVRIFKIVFFLIFINVLGIIPVFAQERASAHEDFWVCPVFEAGFYSISNIAIGGGAALGYGDRLAFGLKVVYWNDREKVRALELNFLARYYFFHMTEKAIGHSGLFIQFSGGPVIFDRNQNGIAMLSDISLISVGLSLGWRFLLGSYFFVEPAVRTGYPYIAGAGLSAGVRF